MGIQAGSEIFCQQKLKLYFFICCRSGGMYLTYVKMQM